MESVDLAKYGPTEIRGALIALLDTHEALPLLDSWQLRVARLRVSQAHYTTYETKQIFRIILGHYRSGALAAAIAKRKEANTPENHAKVKACVEAHADGKLKEGCFWCPVCNTGANLSYHLTGGRLAAMCENRECVRLLRPGLKGYVPRFANIVPQGYGAFLVESMTRLGEFYAVDALEMTCSCDAFRFTKGEMCKHISNVVQAVYVCRAF